MRLLLVLGLAYLAILFVVWCLARSAALADNDWSDE